LLINSPVKTEVKPERIQQFFKEVVNVKVPINPMSTNEATHDKYNVGEGQGFHVALADKSGKTIADVVIGQGASYSFSYIRNAKQSNVFQMKTNAYNLCKPDLGQWRTNIVVDITEEKTAKVHVVHGDNDYEMIRTPGEVEATWTYKDKDEEFVVDRANAPLRKFYGVFNGLKCYSFRDNQWDELSKYFETPAVVATFYLTDGTQHTLTFAKETDSKVLMKRDNYTDTIFGSSVDILSRLSFTKDKFKEHKIPDTVIKQ
jgi:hypothetical protein